MVRRRTRAPHPAELIARGDWPTGQLVDGAPEEAHYAQGIARNLERALQGLSIREIAKAAGLSHSTVYDLLNGVTYGEVITIARLEDVLGTRLWPSRQRPRPRPRPRPGNRSGQQP